MTLDSILVPFDGFSTDSIFRRRLQSPFSQSNFFDESRSELGSKFTTMEQDTKNGRYSLTVPLGNQIQPEDLKISIKDGIMSIDAKKEVKSENGDSSSRIYQEISRKFTLPQGIDQKEVKSILGADGKLVIEVPIPKPSIQEARKPREIPINIQ